MLYGEVNSTWTHPFWGRTGCGGAALVVVGVAGLLVAG